MMVVNSFVCIFCHSYAKVLPYSDDLPKRHLDLPELCDEDGGDGLVQRRAVHVDSRSDGDHETCDTRIQAHVVTTTYRNWHRC